MRLLLVGDVALPLLDALEPVFDLDALLENVMARVLVLERLVEKLPDSVVEDTRLPLLGGALPEDATSGVLSPHRIIF